MSEESATECHEENAKEIKIVTKPKSDERGASIEIYGQYGSFLLFRGVYGGGNGYSE